MEEEEEEEEAQRQPTQEEVQAQMWRSMTNESDFRTGNT
jgi:hypothetical protein